MKRSNTRTAYDDVLQAYNAKQIDKALMAIRRLSAACDEEVRQNKAKSPLRFANKARLRVSVVVPAMNEARNLPHVLPHIPRWVHEVILVDGHSTDNTTAIAARLLPNIRILQQQGRGKGAALRTGFMAAEGDIIVMLDADGSTDPREIPAFVGLLLSGADYVKGSRYLQGGGSEDLSWFRSMGNRGLLFAVRSLFGYRFTDLCYGYNAFWRAVLPVIQPDCDGFEIETLMNLRAAKAGLKIAEVPSFEASRVHGESRLRPIRDGSRVLRTILSERARSLSGAPAQRQIPTRLGA